MKRFIIFFVLISIVGCKKEVDVNLKSSAESIPPPDYTITEQQKTHYKFSSKIPPIIKVPDGSIIEAVQFNECDAVLKPFESKQWPVRNFAEPPDSVTIANE